MKVAPTFLTLYLFNGTASKIDYIPWRACDENLFNLQVAMFFSPSNMTIFFFLALEPGMGISCRRGQGPEVIDEP